MEKTIINKFLALVQEYKNNEDVLDIIEHGMNNFMLYVQSVYTMEVRLPIIKFTKEGQDLIDAIAQLDTYRRHAHEAAIASCNVIGRIAKAADMDPLFDGDSNDRLAVADFCMQTVDEFFAERKGTDKTMTLQDWIDAAKKIS